MAPAPRTSPAPWQRMHARVRHRVGAELLQSAARFVARQPSFRNRVGGVGGGRYCWRNGCPRFLGAIRSRSRSDRWSRLGFGADTVAHNGFRPRARIWSPEWADVGSHSRVPSFVAAGHSDRGGASSGRPRSRQPPSPRAQTNDPCSRNTGKEHVGCVAPKLGIYSSGELASAPQIETTPRAMALAMPVTRRNNLGEARSEIPEARRASKSQVRTSVLSSPSEAAASANRAKAGSDLAPILFMIEARWFSTVRWLIPRSAAMFLLG